MGFALEAPKKKKLMPSIWGEDGEKKAMKENLHCVESHEAESALFFGGLKKLMNFALEVQKKKSSCQAFGKRMEKEKL